MLQTEFEITRALRRYSDVFDAKTGSIIMLSRNGHDPNADPFRRGFIEHFDERAELVRRLRRLDHRERCLLLLWYVYQWKVSRIARFLRISRQHCYHLKGRALERLVEMGSGPEDERQRTGAPASRPRPRVVSSRVAS